MSVPGLLTLGVLILAAIAVLVIHYPDTDRAATRRWKQRNAEQPTTCMCGQPGAVKRYSGYPVRGKVQPFWWMCEEHAATPLTTPWTNGVPMVQDVNGVWHEPIESLVRRGLVEIVEDDR